MALSDSFELTGLLTEDCQYVRFNHWKVFQKTLTKWVGKDVLITITVVKYKRSAAQNRYYWYIIELIRHWFYDTQGEKFTKDELHIWVRKNLLGESPRITMIAGEEVITMTSKKSSAMTTVEFAAMVDTIREKMLLRGLDIPEPQKGKRLNLVEEYLTDD